ncbi:MAG TPA: hypothetical protein VN363_09930, partial [Anaerolineales bacterium]|nr:hypothetical protein [Anaerolineales bacterium]
PTQIDLVNLDGSNRRPAVLTFEMVLTYSEYMISPPVTWAADSSMVWAAIPPHDALGAPPQITTVWQIPVEGSPAVKTAEFQAAPLVGFELPVSPDTQHLVYLAETGEQPDIQYELHLAALDGSSNQILHTAPFMDFLSWSPDGQRFAVSVGNEQALYLGEAAGSFAPAPGSPAGVSDLDWMDEAQFVYVQTGAGGASLVHGAVTGTPQVMDSLNGGFIPYSVR